MINNKKLTSYLATMSLLFTLALSASCSSGADEPAMISAGQSTRGFSKLSYGSISTGDNNVSDSHEPQVVELCEFAPGVDSLSIVEVTASPYLVQETDCEGPFGNVAIEVPLKTWAVVAGLPVPENFKGVTMNASLINDLSVGDMLLANVYTVDEHVMVTELIRVVDEGSFDSTEEYSVGGLVYDFPSTFEGLAAAATPIYEDYDAACPDIDHGSNSGWVLRSPGGRQTFAYSPEFRGNGDQCNPSDPEPEPEPDLNNPRVYCEMADAPSCCFDDTVVCPYLED